MFYKKTEDLGEHYLSKNNFIYWGKNPWNNFYQYKLDKKNLLLTQKYILKKNSLNRVLSNLFNKSNYYVMVNDYQCKILNDWEDVERYLGN